MIPLNHKSEEFLFTEHMLSFANGISAVYLFAQVKSILLLLEMSYKMHALLDSGYKYNFKQGKKLSNN